MGSRRLPSHLASLSLGDFSFLPSFELTYKYPRVFSLAFAFHELVAGLVVAESEFVAMLLIWAPASVAAAIVIHPEILAQAQAETGALGLIFSMTAISLAATQYFATT